MTVLGLEVGAKHPDLPVRLAARGSCFAVGERWAGAGRGSADLLGVSLGDEAEAGLVLAGTACRTAAAST